MDAILSLLPSIIVHWPFLSVTVCLMIVFEVLDRNVFSVQAARSSRAIFWTRKTLSIPPIVVGMLVGLVWRNPAPGIDTLAESIGYFALAGALSAFAWEAIEALAKSRGIDIGLPGVEDP